MTPVGKPDHGSVGKGRFAIFHAEHAKDRQMGYPAKRQQNAGTWLGLDLVDEEPPAGPDLRTRGPVRRRNTANGIDDSAIRQFQPVIDALVETVIGPSVPCKRRIENLASEIARKRPPGAVRPGDTRSETDNQKRSVPVAESGDRTIVPGRLPQPLLTEEFRETRAELAVRIWLTSIFGRRR